MLKRERYSKAEIVLRDSEKAKQTIQKLKTLVKENTVKDYAWAIHDQDRYTSEDVERGIITKDQIGTLKTKHWHIGFSLTKKKDFSAIAKIFAVEENAVQKIHDSQKRFPAYLAYLTHKNATDKYQYSDEIVHTTIKDWKHDRDMAVSSKMAKRASEEMPLYLDEIQQGKLTRSKIREAKSKARKGTADLEERALSYAYSKRKKDFEDFFEDFKRALGVDRTKEKQVIFLEGRSGQGKTRLCLEIAKKLYTEVCLAGAKNDPFGSYKDEETVILDDVRADEFDFTDWLSLLDDSYNFEAQSRFKNKFIYADYYFLTSAVSFDDWLKTFNTQEDIFQFKRRIKFIITIKETEAVIKNNLTGEQLGKIKIDRDKITHHVKFDKKDIESFIETCLR